MYFFIDDGAKKAETTHRFVELNLGIFAEFANELPTMKYMRGNRTYTRPSI